MALHDAEYQTMTTLTHEACRMHRLSQELHEALVDGESSRGGRIISINVHPVSERIPVEAVRVFSKG